MGGARERGLRARRRCARRRGVRGGEPEQLPDREPDDEPGGDAGRRGLPGDAGQRQGLPRHAGVLQAEPEGPGRHHPDRVLHLAGRGADGLSGSAHPPVRPGARGRRLDQRAAGHRLSLRAGHDPVPRWSLPRVRRARAGHGGGRGRGGGRAQAPPRRARRRRPRASGDPRSGHQQRRLAEGGLHRPERGRAGRGHRPGPRDGGLRSLHDHLRGGPRNRHRARRSHRDRGADQGLPGRHRPARVLRARIGEDQHRPSRRRRGCRGADQDGPGPRASRPAAEPALRGAEPEHRFRERPVPGERRSRRLGALGRCPAPRRRELIRHRRHQRARGAGGSARAPGACSLAPGAGLHPVRPLRRGAGASRRRPGGAPRGALRAGPRRRGVHAAPRPGHVPTSPRGGGGEPG